MLGPFPYFSMRPIDHTLRDHSAKKHKPYSFAKDQYATWTMQVPAGHVAHVLHGHGGVTQHEEEVELPKGSTLLKMERK